MRLPPYKQHLLPVAGLSRDELDVLERTAREVSTAAPGVREISETVLAAVKEQRRPKLPFGSDRDAAYPLPDVVTADPADVVVHQPEAMARATQLRDDPALSPRVRAVWGAVVDRLADLRHQAKAGLYERRMRGADPGMDLAAEQRAMAAARANDADPDDELGRFDPVGAPGIDSGRDEPAPWQTPNDRVGATGA